MSKITSKKGQSRHHSRKGNGGCPHKSTAKTAAGASEQKAPATLGTKAPEFTQNTETEVIAKTGEHRLDHKNVVACIQYAEHKGIWVDEEEEATEGEDDEIDPDFDWSEWTEDERDLALYVSDVLCDLAADDSINLDVAVTMDEESLKDRIVEWLSSDDPSEVAHAHTVAECRGFDITDLVAKVTAESEHRHLSTVLDQEHVEQQDEAVTTRRL